MCLNHTAQVDMHKERRYAGKSPEEVACLEAAQRVGLAYENKKLMPGKSTWEISIRDKLTGDLKAYEVLCEIPFDSARKRMTVIVDIEGTIHAISKGADSVMMSLCSQEF